MDTIKSDLAASEGPRSDCEQKQESVLTTDESDVSPDEDSGYLNDYRDEQNGQNERHGKTILVYRSEAL
jgi:hypothetical protein